MLIFLLESQTQEEVKRVFDMLEEQLGTELFRKLFEVILTDGGTEFAGGKSWRQPWIKAGEQPYTTAIHTHSGRKDAAKRIMSTSGMSGKKGSSFDDLRQSDVDLLAIHINNTKRDSLNGHSPFELSQMLLDEKLFTVMNYRAVDPDDIMLTPELLR